MIAKTTEHTVLHQRMQNDPRVPDLSMEPWMFRSCRTNPELLWAQVTSVFHSGLLWWGYCYSHIGFSNGGILLRNSTSLESLPMDVLLFVIILLLLLSCLSDN